MTVAEVQVESLTKDLQILKLQYEAAGMQQQLLQVQYVQKLAELSKLTKEVAEAKKAAEPEKKDFVAPTPPHPVLKQRTP